MFDNYGAHIPSESLLTDVDSSTLTVPTRCPTVHYVMQNLKNEVLLNKTNLQCVFRILRQKSYAGIYRSKECVTMCRLCTKPWRFQTGGGKVMAWGIKTEFTTWLRQFRPFSSHQFNIPQAGTIISTTGWKPFMNQDASQYNLALLNVLTQF